MNQSPGERTDFSTAHLFNTMKSKELRAPTPGITQHRNRSCVLVDTAAINTAAHRNKAFAARGEQ